MQDHDAKMFIYGSKLVFYTFIDKGEQLIENVAVSEYLCLLFFAKKTLIWISRI